MDQLRAGVYLALLTGQPITAPTEHGRPLAASCARGGSGEHDGPGEHGGLDERSGPFGPGGRGVPCEPSQSPGTCACGPTGSVNLTMPLGTWLGLSDAPGHATGYGPLDADDSRDLAALLAKQSGSCWCVTATGEDGRPVAHGCARTGPGPSGGPRPPPRSGASPRSASGGSHPPPPNIMDWLAGITISKLETGECSHLRESPCYRPPSALRQLITIRQPTCSFPGCRRPAARCDQRPHRRLRPGREDM
jgi:hypothetical protein